MPVLEQASFANFIHLTDQSDTMENELSRKCGCRGNPWFLRALCEFSSAHSAMKSFLTQSSRGKAAEGTEKNYPNFIAYGISLVSPL
jgi:hypothetical protein